MRKLKISDEAFAELENEDRHDEIMKLLRNLSPNGEADKLTRLINSCHDSLMQTVRATERKNVDFGPLLTELQEVKRLLQKPKSFKVIRDNAGLIERIVVE